MMSDLFLLVIFHSYILPNSCADVTSFKAIFFAQTFAKSTC